jgi:hypothetical protein
VLPFPARHAVSYAHSRRYDGERAFPPLIATGRPLDGRPIRDEHFSKKTDET